MHRQHQWKSLRFFENELCPVKHNSLNFLLSSFQDQTNGPKKKEGTQTKQTKDGNPSSIEKYHRHTNSIPTNFSKISRSALSKET